MGLEREREENFLRIAIFNIASCSKFYWKIMENYIRRKNWNLSEQFVTNRASGMKIRSA